MKKATSIDPRDVIVQRIRCNPAFAVAHCNAALNKHDQGAFLTALRRIAEARGGLAKVAKAAGITRESLYRALSERGNPRLSTLQAVTRAVGLKLSVEAA